MTNGQIIGHKNITDYLEHCLNNDKLSHAYLFVGADHLGKRTVLDWFCRKINGEKYQQDCQYISRQSDESEKIAKKISISRIREVMNGISLSNFDDNYKIIVIDRAEDLTNEAANAILKNLEEPPRKTIFFLISNNTSSVMPTIVSRCQVIRFNAVSCKDISGWLAEKETENKDFICDIVCGQPGLAVELTNNPDSLSIFQNKIANMCQLMNGRLSEQLLGDDDLAAEDVVSIEYCLKRQIQSAITNEQYASVIGLAEHVRVMQTLLQSNTNSKLSIDSLFL